MAHSIWGSLFSLVQGTPAKRRQQVAAVQGFHAERLEDRALLTARAFDFPQVAGTWDLTVASDPAGTAVITQNGKSVTAVVSVTGLPELTIKDKFTKKDPDTLSGKVKIKDVELGKFTIDMTVTFAAGTGSPTAFTGSAVTPESTVNFAGEKQVGGSAALPKKAPDFHEVDGTYDFSISHEEIGEFEGVLTLTQDGKGGRDLHGTVAIEQGPTITFDAKFDKKDPSTITGTINIPVEELGRTVKGKFTNTQFNEAFDFVSGSVTIKRTSPADFSATLQA